MRVALAIQADRSGYILTDVFRVDGNAVHDEVSFRLLEELAIRIDVHTILIVGTVDRLRVGAAVNKAGLKVRWVERAQLLG